jgi:hypothetical protein
VRAALPRRLRLRGVRVRGRCVVLSETNTLSRVRSARLVKGTVAPRQPVPPHIGRPPYADSGKVPTWREGYQVQDEQARSARAFRCACILRQ